MHVRDLERIRSSQIEEMAQLEAQGLSRLDARDSARKQPSHPSSSGLRGDSKAASATDGVLQSPPLKLPVFGSTPRALLSSRSG
eukprot:gene41513-50659_t